ncbi:MAG: type II secretion system protein M [Anaerolineales bacterium]|nr:type II secretion system protein M [Anaerolineales bacterium]
MVEGEFKELEPGEEQPENQFVDGDAPEETEPVAAAIAPDVEESASVSEEDLEAVPLEEMEAEGPEGPAEPAKEPSKFNLLMRKLLRWGAGIALIFVLGIVVTWFVRVSPLQNELTETQDSLQTAQQEVDSLQGEVSDLQDTRDTLEAENQSLESQLTTALADQQILRVLADVSAARVALAEDDLITAKAALSGTEARLAALLDILPPDVQDTVQGMISRLTLVLDEINDDSFAAENDLEVLWTNLQALESSLFQ